MKIRTWIALGVGYALGAKLGPEQIEAAIRGAIDGERRADGVGTVRRTVDDVAWPEPSFDL